MINDSTEKPQLPPAVQQALNAPLPEREYNPPNSVFVREILETLLFMFFIIWFVRAGTQNFRIEGSSMLPTLHEGEYLIVNRIIYQLEDPQRGDIVVLQYPNDRSRDFIKRIIGLPGDTVEIANDQVRVNGVILNEPYISAPPKDNNTWVVPEGHYFVVGDNRLNSSDSRSWSYLPESDLIGRAWLVYWPFTDWQFVPHHTHNYIPEPATING